MTPQKPPLREDSRPVDPDSYWQLRLWIPRESEELWTMHCLDRGALGAQCHQEQETALEMGYFFGEAPPWTAQELAGEFQTLYPHLKGPESMELLRLPTERWELSWREHFAPLEVGRRLIIRPPWDASAQDAQDRLSIIINPGQGFGTGRHQTTALVLGLLEWWLERRPELPSQMLDVGAGSGVLALAACRMGVPRATLLDIDPAVAPEIQGNFALNGMAGREAVVLGGPECLAGVFQLITANILAPVLKDMGGVLSGLTAPDGCLILSGILVEEAPGVRECYGALGMTPLREDTRDEWYACILQPSQQERVPGGAGRP